MASSATSEQLEGDTASCCWPEGKGQLLIFCGPITTHTPVTPLHPALQLCLLLLATLATMGEPCMNLTHLQRRAWHLDHHAHLHGHLHACGVDGCKVR